MLSVNSKNFRLSNMIGMVFRPRPAFFCSAAKRVVALLCAFFLCSSAAFSATHASWASTTDFLFFLAFGAGCSGSFFFRERTSFVDGRSMSAGDGRSVLDGSERSDGFLSPAFHSTPDPHSLSRRKCIFFGEHCCEHHLGNCESRCTFP